MATSGGEAETAAAREACRELARRLATPEGLRTARLLQQAGALLPPVSPMPREAAAPEQPEEPQGFRPISIWQPEQRGAETVFVRPQPLPLGDHHAARRELHPRRGPRREGEPRRLAFFGESAAAGYLYAPHLTPAQVLDRQLAGLCGEGAWEVIDLARTNESLGPMLATVERSLQLSPDALVVFAGNNWNLLEAPELSPYAPSVGGRQLLGAAYADGGLAALAALHRRRVAERAGAALEALAGLAREAGLPVVLVIPEVNLGDWESRQPVGWLPGNGTARWWRLCREAEALLASGEHRPAAAVAWRMIELDGETCPTSCRLLARACQGLGEGGKAALAARTEIDAESYPTLCGLGSPRATSWAQELLRRAADRFGFAAVDLPALFAGEGEGALPGRGLFLDYCHLSRPGMALAMAGVAARVRELFGHGGAGPDWRERARQIAREHPGTQLPPEADALAELGAAVHTAHRLLPTPAKAGLLAGGAGRALEVSPGVEEALWSLVAARAAPAPAVLTAAQRENLASPYRLLLQHGWRWDFLDAELLLACGEALEARGVPARQRIARALLAGRPPAASSPAGARAGEADLSRPPYLWEPLARFYPDALPNRDLPARAFLRSPWPATGFCLLAAGDRPVALTACLRLPSLEGAPGRRHGRVGVAVNGSALGEVAAGESWSRHRLEVPASLLRPGLNRVELSWPEPPPWGDAARERIVRRLELGLPADLHAVFGEVASLQAGPISAGE